MVAIAIRNWCIQYKHSSSKITTWTPQTRFSLVTAKLRFASFILDGAGLVEARPMLHPRVQEACAGHASVGRIDVAWNGWPMNGFIGPQDIFRNSDAIWRFFERTIDVEASHDNVNIALSNKVCWGNGPSPFNLVFSHSGSGFAITCNARSGSVSLSEHVAEVTAMRLHVVKHLVDT